MKSKSRLRPARNRWILPAILTICSIAIAVGLVLFRGPGTEQDPALGGDPDIMITQADVRLPANKEKSPKVGYERISDEEFAKRAASSPDQANVNQRFSRHPDMENQNKTAGLAWQAIGPRPFTDEYWSGNDDASGRVCALLVDPIDPDIAYAGGAQGGVWKTIDAGANWIPLTDGLSSLASGALAFDPYDSDIIYFGTGEQHYSGDSYYGDGLFRSADAGDSWTKIAAKANVGSYISRVVVDLDDTDIIYLSSDLGFLRSTDAGVNWNVELGPGHCTDIALDPFNSGVVYCGFRSSGIWKSVNYGANWTKLDNGMPVDGFRRINIALAPSNTSVIYASFATPGGDLFGMYKTLDGGDNWFLLPATPDYLGSQGNYDNCIIVDPVDEDICYAGGTFPFGGVDDFGLIRTADGGNSWTDINVGVDGSQPHADHHIFAFGNDGRLWIGNDGGVWHTIDGGQHWVNCNATLSLAQLYTNTIHPTNSNFVLGGTQDNGSARFEGVDAWPQVSAGDGGPCAIEWDSPNIYYTSYVKLKNLVKYDNGAYQGIFTGPWDGDRVNWCRAPLVVDQNQPNTLVAGTHRVWRTTDSAETWTPISGDLTEGNGHLRAIAIAEGASNTIYTGSSDGLVYLTTDAVNWELRSAFLPSAVIPDIAVDPEDWQKAYLCSGQTYDEGVFYTDDGGVNWVGITGDLPVGLMPLSLAVDFRTTPPRLYLGTDYGIYASLDDGWTWVKADAGLPSLAIYDVTVDSANSLLVAGTHGRGMWRAPLDVTAPTLVLTSPVGGEAWTIGNDYNITWTASDDHNVSAVSLLLSRDGGLTYPEVLALDIENTGTFNWLVDGEASENCRIQVYAEDESSNDVFVESEDDFVISSGVSGSSDMPMVTSLKKAYPNPFNPRTTISFDLAKDSHALLQVFSIDGHLIQTLVDQSLRSGPHHSVWNGTDLQGRAVASGNYLYTLTTTDGYRQSGKVMLMK